MQTREFFRYTPGWRVGLYIQDYSNYRRILGCNRNVGISKAPLENQAHHDTSLFTGTEKQVRKSSPTLQEMYCNARCHCVKIKENTGTIMK